MDIKVGEYVRTNRGIFKILEIKTVKTKMDGNHDKAYKLDKFKSLWFSKTDFIKHSFDLIDLIEVGDYVNGEYVTDTWNGNRIETHRSNFHEDNIKSIVTKEQFESMEYKV